MFKVVDSFDLNHKSTYLFGYSKKPPKYQFLCEVGPTNQIHGLKGTYQYKRTFSNHSKRWDFNLYLSRREALNNSWQLINFSSNSRQTKVSRTTRGFSVRNCQRSQHIGDYIWRRVTWNQRVLDIHDNKSIMCSRNCSIRRRVFAWHYEGRRVSRLHWKLVFRGKPTTIQFLPSTFADAKTCELVGAPYLGKHFNNYLICG